MTHFTVKLILTGMALMTMYVICPLSDLTPVMTNVVASRISQSGVRNPVTAVLLNFRAYDTLLELVVLLTAAIGVYATGSKYVWLRRSWDDMDEISALFLRVLMPFLILFSVYLLWVGAEAPGGAFQGGAVLAAIGVLMLVSGFNIFHSVKPICEISLLIIGPLTFTIIAGALTLYNGRLLQYPPEQAGSIIIVIEAASMMSIAIILLTLFCGDRLTEPTNHEST